MNLKGNKFYFDRCLKFVFTGPNLTVENADGTRGNAPLTIEYCPRKDERLCPHLEADIKDMPSPNEKDRPGYSGVLKIYNPGRDILTLVAKSVTWFYDYASKGNGEPAAAKNQEGAAQRYYNNKLKVAVYAGYWDEDINDGGYGNAPIMAGYVNNTYYYRQNTDDVLVLYCHDVDMAKSGALANAYGEMFAKDDDAIDNFMKQMDERRSGKQTFDQTFKHLVDNWGQQYLAFSSKQDSTTEFISGLTGTKKEKYQVFYVSDPSAYYADMQAKGGQGAVVEDPTLANYCRNAATTQHFYTNASSIEGMLNELCNYGGVSLDWQFDNIYTRTPVFIVYRKEKSITPVKGIKDKGVVQIWNFQNMLEQPTIDGTGSISLKMFFNKQCVPWAYVALQMTDSNELGDGVATVEQMGLLSHSGRIVGGFAGQAQNPAIATTQLSGSAAIGAVLNNNSRGASFGYLFNHAYLIVSTQHKLNTHGNEWMTHVKTVPLIRGKLATENTR